MGQRVESVEEDKGYLQSIWQSDINDSEFSIKTIQWDWDKFYAASSGAGTARKENLYQFHVDI